MKRVDLDLGLSRCAAVLFHHNLYRGMALFVLSVLIFEGIVLGSEGGTAWEVRRREEWEEGEGRRGVGGEVRGGEGWRGRGAKKRVGRGEDRWQRCEYEGGDSKTDSPPIRRRASSCTFGGPPP